MLRTKSVWSPADRARDGLRILATILRERLETDPHPSHATPLIGEELTERV